MSLKGTPVQCSGRVPEESLENPSNYSFIHEKKQLICEGVTAAHEDNYTKTDPQSLDSASFQGNSETYSASSHANQDSFTCTVVTDDMNQTNPTVSKSNIENSMSDVTTQDSLPTSSTHVKSLVNRAKLSSTEEKPERLVPITIWDFGGQEVFYTTHQTFLSSSCVYMMAFNLFEQIGRAHV